MSAPFRTGISVLYAGARWQVLHVLDAETVLLRAVLSARHAPRAKRLKRPALSDGSPARIPVPQRPGRGCRLTARPATFACVTVPAWSDSVTDHGQEYVTELVSGSLRGANPMNAADRLYAVTLEAWRHRKAFARWKARRQRRGKTPQESAALRRRRAALITGWLGAGGQRDRREGAFLVQPDDCYAALNAETPAFAGTVAYALSLIS